MHKNGIHLCALAAAMIFAFSPDAEARRLGGSGSHHSTSHHEKTGALSEDSSTASAGTKLNISSHRESSSAATEVAPDTPGSTPARPLSPEEQKRMEERRTARQAEEDRLRKVLAERQLAENIKAEEEKARLEKQAAAEKLRQENLERKEKARLAEEQRIQDLKDRERQCVILPVMSDAQIATCREVWR